jgi:hypothetical protein
MQANRIWIAAGILAVATAGPASAATKVQGNIISVEDGSDLYNFAKPGKFAFKESKDAGGGGMSLQLNLKGIDCPAGDPNKCDSSDNVMEISVAFGGGALETHTGILFDVAGGKAVFPQTGKNKVSGADVFGVIASVTQGQTLGLGLVRIHATASNPAACANPVLLPGNTCTDGETYGVSGVIPSNEPGTGPSCTMTSECDANIPVLECTGGTCEIEPCAQDSDCHQDGLNPDVACNEDSGTCCQLSGGDPDCDNEP